MSKPKPVNWTLIEKNDVDGHQIYDMVADIIEKYHSGDNSIQDVNYIIMWRHNIKVDRDGYVLLADISKSSDKIRELRPHDFIIGINKDAWHFMDGSQKQAVIDTQLERIAICLDKEDNPKEDDRSRTLYRLRKPQVVDEATIERRHNTTTQKVQEFICNKFTNGGADSGSYVAEVMNS